MALTKPQKLLLPILVSCLLTTPHALAEGLQIMRLQPIGTLEALAGKGEVVQGQLLLPLVGNAEHIWFADMEGRFGTSKNDSMLGVAAGYRKLVNDRVLGGYLEVNYNHLHSGLHTWFVNPGLESLGTVWDFRVNGYLPVTCANRNTTTSTTDWAPEFDNYDHIRFAGHTMYDHMESDIYKTDEQMGRGLDAEVGRTVPGVKGLKLYLGGYHFDTKSLGSVNGAAARVTYELNDYVSLEGKYNYDNAKRNVALFGFKFTFNGPTTKEKDVLGISARLLDNIEHNISTIGNGTATPVKAQDSHYYTVNPTEQVQYNNVWFVNPNAAAGGDGTYEHPLSEFDVNVLEQIEQTVDPVILLAPGTYNLDIPEGLQLVDGIVLEGTDLHFLRPDEDDDIININGDFIVGSNSVLKGLTIEDAAANYNNTIYFEGDEGRNVIDRFFVGAILNGSKKYFGECSFNSFTINGKTNTFHDSNMQGNLLIKGSDNNFFGGSIGNDPLNYELEISGSNNNFYLGSKGTIAYRLLTIAGSDNSILSGSIKVYSLQFNNNSKNNKITSTVFAKYVTDMGKDNIT
ncbi:MAG: hypothetical protein WCW01_06665 [Gammaproteobacteria bacterium]